LSSLAGDTRLILCYQDAFKIMDTNKWFRACMTMTWKVSCDNESGELDLKMIDWRLSSCFGGPELDKSESDDWSAEDDEDEAW
jgi:hypothetical protein